MLVLSANSINSRWVETEIEAAFEKERRNNTAVLIPIQLDDSAVETLKAWAADIRRILQIGDFRNWQDDSSYRQSLEQLLDALKIDATAA